MAFHIWRQCPRSILRICLQDVFLLLEQRGYIRWKKAIIIPTFRLLKCFLNWSLCFHSCPNRVSFFHSNQSNLYEPNSDLMTLFSLKALRWLSITLRMKSKYFTVLCKALSDLVYDHFSNLSPTTLCLFCSALLTHSPKLLLHWVLCTHMPSAWATFLSDSPM